MCANNLICIEAVGLEVQRNTETVCFLLQRKEFNHLVFPVGHRTCHVVMRRIGLMNETNGVTATFLTTPNNRCRPFIILVCIRRTFRPTREDEVVCHCIVNSVHLIGPIIAVPVYVVYPAVPTALRVLNRCLFMAFIGTTDMSGTRSCHREEDSACCFKSLPFCELNSILCQIRLIIQVEETVEDIRSGRYIPVIREEHETVNGITYCRNQSNDGPEFIILRVLTAENIVPLASADGTPVFLCEQSAPVLERTTLQVVYVFVGNQETVIGLAVAPREEIQSALVVLVTEIEVRVFAKEVILLLCKVPFLCTNIILQVTSTELYFRIFGDREEAI